MITGASSGIGKEIAYLLAEAGSDLFLLGRNQAELEKIKNDLSAKRKVQTLAIDLCSHEGTIVLHQMINSHKPDLIIHSAGFGLYGPAIDQSLEELMKMIQLHNQISVAISVIGAKTLIQAEKKGTIVLLSSAAAFFPYPFFSVYSASKAFVKHFAESFDGEVASQGVRVLASCPGMVSTPFRKTAAKGKEVGSTMFDITPKNAAKAILKQITEQKKVEIFDWRYKVFVAVARILPKKWVEKVLIKSMKKRY